MTNQNRKQENHNSKNHDPANQCVTCGNEMPEGDHVCKLCREQEEREMTPPRYIDADALLDEAQNGGWDADIKELQMVLKYVPEIDATPVVRGEWVVDECDSTDDVPSYSWICFHCSECNADYDLEEGQYGWCRYEKIPYNYCPNCGAKMEDKPCE